MAKSFGYVEPGDYFPKSVRKKNQIGEYNTDYKKASREKKREGAKNGRKKG